MSATEIVEQFRKLSAAERREVIERLRDEFMHLDSELANEDRVELDRRAEDTLKHPGRGKRAEEIFSDIKSRFSARH